MEIIGIDEKVSQPTGLGGKLRQLFSSKKKPEEIKLKVNLDDLLEGETYEHLGTRICGKVEGSLKALTPYLHKVYNSMYKSQAEDKEKQVAARAIKLVEIESKNTHIRLENEKIDNAIQDLDDTKKKIEELQDERGELKAAKEGINKDQKLKLIIGMVIIIPLTFYLFLFYSSTFYSAFFRDPSSMTDVMNSMFDSHALANAYADGMAELGFVLSAPIIFLGLGFSLHFFSVQKGFAKYFKMAAILLVTVMFDCILAYKIGEQIHTVGILIGQYPIGEEYTVSMAIHDINTWVVIFCGFIVYVIWGIVFDMCMSAYSKLDLNKTRMESIKKEIEKLELKIKDDKAEIHSMKQKVANAKQEVDKMLNELNNNIYINYSTIRAEMNNFFAGWMTQMKVLSMRKDLLDEANSIYQNEVARLFPEKETSKKEKDNEKDNH